MLTASAAFLMPWKVVAMSARIISLPARPAASSAALLMRRPEESRWTLVDSLS
jgi:hypothetical protein